MSELEIITLTLSLVLGLSVAQMLGAVATAIRARHENPLHWIPLCWAGAIFLFHIQFFFAVFGLDQTVGAWTWDWYGHVLLLAVLLFLSGALILPTRDRDLTSGLLDDFKTHGRLALIPVSLYLLLWMPLNVRSGEGPWLSSANAADVALGIIAAVAFSNRATRVRAVATLAYLSVTAWGVFVVWGRPGVDD